MAGQKKCCREFMCQTLLFSSVKIQSSCILKPLEKLNSSVLYKFKRQNHFPSKIYYILNQEDVKILIPNKINFRLPFIQLIAPRYLTNFRHNLVVYKVIKEANLI